jgi:hypothetical protein
MFQPSASSPRLKDAPDGVEMTSFPGVESFAPNDCASPPVAAPASRVVGS